MMISHMLRGGSLPRRLPTFSSLPNNAAVPHRCSNLFKSSSSFWVTGSVGNVRSFSQPITTATPTPQQQQQQQPQQQMMKRQDGPVVPPPQPPPFVNPDFLHERMGNARDYLGIHMMDIDIMDLEDRARDMRQGSGNEILEVIQNRLLDYLPNFVWFTENHLTRLFAVFKLAMHHGQPVSLNLALSTASLLAQELVAHGMHPDLLTFQYLLDSDSSSAAAAATTVDAAFAVEGCSNAVSSSSVCSLLIGAYSLLVGSERGISPEETITHSWRLFEQLKQHLQQLQSKNNNTDNDEKQTPTPNVLVKLIDAMAICGSQVEMERAIREARQLGFFPSNIDVVNACIKGSLKIKHDLQSAFKFFEESRKASVRPTLTTFRSLLETCTALHDPHHAWKLFDEFKLFGIKLDADAFSTLLNTMTSCKSAEGFARAVREFQSSGLRPNSDLWCSLIHGYGNFNKKIDKALSVLDTMRSSNVKPNLFTLLTLLEVCARHQDLERAHNLFHHLISDEKVDPSTDHFRVLLDMAVKLKNPIKFEETVRMLKNSGLPYDRDLQNHIKNGRIALSSVAHS